MGKFTFLIAFMLAFFTAGYGQVSGYTFSQSTGNTYTEITGGTVVVTCTDCTTSYDSSSWIITLPTPVYFNGAMVSSVVMRADGSLVMGSTTETSAVGPIAATTTATGVISPLGMDLRSSTVAGTTYEIRWQDTGSSYVFQWKNASRWSQNTVEKLNFQVRINKATGVVTMAYGEMVVAANTTYQPQVGLRGTTNSDYNNRRLTTTIPDATPSWEDTAVGSSNSHTVLFTSGSPAAFPASGLNFTYSPPACVPPIAVTSSNVGSITATIQWQNPFGAPAAGYDYYVSTSSTAPTAATIPTGNQAIGTTLNLTTLTPSTQYYVFIRANCGGSSSSWSSAVSFTTTQIPGVIPFIENFESANNWGIANGTQTNKFFIGNFIANGGTNSLYVSNNATGANNDYSHTTSTVHAYRDIAIPLGTTDVIVSFDWRGLGEDGFDFLRLSVVPTTFIPAAGTQITAANSGGVIIADNLQGTSTFNTFTGSFNAAQYAGQTVRLVFSWRNDSGDGGNPAGAIDNVNISIPTCLIPSGLQAASAAGDVTLNWSIAGGAPSGGYDIFVSGTNTAPSAGTAATHTSPTNTITISNLTGDAVYYYWVRSNCGVDGLSIWSFGGSFRLDCAAVVPPTTLETFTAYESTLPAPDCWREAAGALTTTPVALTGTTSLWTGENFNNSTTSDNGKAARVELYATRNDWMISPAYNLGTGPVTYQLEYTASVIPWSGSTTVTNMGEKYVKVVISTDGGLTWSDANVVKTYNNDNIPSTPQMEYISLAGYTGIVKIGFYGHSTTTTQDLRFYIDNFRVIETPACLTPLTPSINVATIGENGGTLAWNAPTVAPANGYQYYVSTTDTDPTATTTPTGTVGAGVTSVVIGALQPSTNYFVWVRSNCGNTVSEWAGPVALRTACDAFDILTSSATAVCGQGTSILTATATGGAIRWYASQTGAPVATGATYTTPFLTESTTFYVATADVQESVTGGARVAPVTTDGTTASTYGLVFDLTEDVTLHSVDVFLKGTSAGTVSMALQNSAGTTLKTVSVAVPAGNATTPVQHTLNLGFEIPAGTGYRLLAISGPNMVRESSVGGFPYALGNLGQVTNGYITGTSTTYYYFYNWHLEALCSGPKVAVPVTVTPAPAFALSAAPAAICEGQTTALVTITEGASDYDTYVWTPSTGVTGNAATGWTFNPAVTTTYTLQASQSTGAMCNANPATVVITVNPLPTVVSVDNITACANTTTPIAVTGGTFTTAAKIGSGSATNTLSTPFKGNWGGTKTQAIYTAAELTALGMQPGDAIKSIGYVIQSGTPSALNDFTINIGLTSQTSVATFINDATTQVFYSAAYTATGVPGTVTFNVDQLVWDGTSNLLVETCFNNVTSGSGSASSLSVESSTAATGLNSYRSQDNNATVCTNTTAPSATTNRPNLVVGYAKSGSLTWSPATNLYTDATALVPYVAGANAPVVYFKSATIGTTSYTVTSTLTTGCSVLDTFDVNVISTPAVTATDITVCGGATVAALTTVATGDNLKWYNVATGGTPLASTTILATGTYHVTQTQNGCESPRTSFVVTVNTVTAPTASALTFCNGTPTVANLAATGADLKWYSAETGGTALAGTTALVTGTYYVSQTVNGCESARTSVAVTVNVSAAPATQDAVFCNPTAALTVADLANNATGSGLKWYADATTATELAATTALVSGTTYFVSQTINGCESPRGEVEVTINITAAPVTQDAVFCNPVAALTVADLANNATGTGLKWYADATATTELAATTALVTGTTYFVSQTINDCEGPRGEVEVTINIAAAPATQDATFCNPVTALTVADLANNATGTGLKWYADAITTTELAATTALVSGTTYFVSQTINGCESPRGEVEVTINIVAAPATQDATFCNPVAALTVADLANNATGTGLKWYADATATTELAATTTLVTGTTYFVSQTINGCEGPRGEVTVTITTVTAEEITDVTVCDSYVLPALTAGNYFTATNGGGTQLAAGAVIEENTEIFVFVQSGTCTAETSFTVTVNGAGAVTGEALQTVGVHNLADATIADLEVTAAGTVTWYATEADALAGTDALASDTQLVNGENYFAVSTVGTCTSAPFEVTVTVTLGKEDFAIQNINYYPNPVVDKLTVSYSSNITQVEVYNLLGQLVISEQPNATTAEVNMARLEAATYIVKVTADGKSKTFKVVRN